MTRELSDFAGGWTLSRRIEDHRTGSVARFEGTATFQAAEHGLTYLETGRLMMPGQAAIHAERRYLWSEAAGRVDIAFDDGRPFHSFSLVDDAPDATHWCDPDHYAVTYDFSGWPRWQAVWRVSGPRKDYTLRSFYARRG